MHIPIPVLRLFEAVADTSARRAEFCRPWEKKVLFLETMNDD
jgi:hypothetical protein